MVKHTWILKFQGRDFCCLNYFHHCKLPMLIHVSKLQFFDLHFHQPLCVHLHDSQDYYDLWHQSKDLQLTFQLPRHYFIDKVKPQLFYQVLEYEIRDHRSYHPHRLLDRMLQGYYQYLFDLLLKAILRFHCQGIRKYRNYELCSHKSPSYYALHTLKSLEEI